MGTRRKSGWQQFADNFDSTYGSFGKFFSALESRDVMNEEVETVYGKDLGLSPHAAPTTYKYAGQSYDKQITPDQLRGLRNQRLVDIETKYSGVKAGLELQKLQADIASTEASTAGIIAGTENMSQQTKLLVAQFPDLAKKIGYDNLSTQATTSLTLARKEDILRMLPHNERIAAAQLINLKWDNKYLDATFDARVTTAKEGAKQSEITTEVAGIDRDLAVATYPSTRDAEIAKNMASISSSGLSQVEDEAAMGPLKEKIAVNDMMTKFRNKAALAPHLGGFADDDAAKDWMVSQMRNINQTLADELEDDYNSHELAGITQQSTMFKNSAEAAYTQGGIEGLSTAIDKLNGVNNTEIEYHDKNKNKVTIWELDPSGKRLRPFVSGTLGEGGDFDMNLQKALDPASSMAISKAYHDDLKTQADIAYTNAMAEKAKAEAKAAGQAAPLDKDKYFVQRLIADPNDQIALHGLLGMDLSMEEIDDLKLNEVMRKAEEAKTNELNTGDTADGGVDRNKDGLVKKDKVTEKVSLNSVEEDLKNAHFIVNNAGDQIGSQTRIGSTKYNDAVALIEALTSPAGINAEIKKLNAAIEASLASAKPNTLQSKNKREKLAERIKELEASLKGIGSGG